MKSIYVLFFTLTFAIQISWSQELKISVGYGYATIESTTSKQNSVNKNILVGAEFKLTSHLIFTAGILYNLISTNQNSSLTSSKFDSHYFFLVPISAKLFTPISNKTNIFIEIGGYPGYNYLRKSEIFINANKSVEKTKDLGYCFGGHLNLGVKNTLSSKYSFDISIGNQTDFFFSNHRKSDKLDANRITLNFSLYRSISK